MADFDSVTINEDERERDPIAHPVRDEEELETAVEQMKAVEDEDLESEVLALRNNLDEFVRRRVGNHNTHIGLMNNPTINEVEIGGEQYQVVGERFFEMNQFPEIGDVGEIRWTALAPQDSWGMETPPNRGGHALGRGREIEAYQLTLDGEPLSQSEIEALSQDIRISEETEQDFTVEAPRMIAEYDSINEVLENEDITEQGFEEELRSAKHRGMVTEDLDLTLKGWMSFMGTNARGLAALERLDGDEESVNLGGFRPSYVPPFGTTEGALSSSGQLSSAIFNDGEVVLAVGSDADADYQEGVMNVEDEAYFKELESIMGDLDPETLHGQPGGRIGLRDALSVFIQNVDGEDTVSIGEDIARGSEQEDYLHDLIDEGLAGIAESNLEGINISLDEEFEQQLEDMGYSVEDIEQRLEEASQGLTPAEDDGFLFGGGDYSLNYEGLEDTLYELFASEIEEIDREQINPEEDRDMDGSAIMGANLLLVDYMDELESHGFDWETVSTYRPDRDDEFFGAELEEQFEEEREELWGDVDYYGHDDIYQEGNIRSPKEMSQEVRGLLRAMEDEDLIRIDHRQIPDRLRLQINTSNEHYETLEGELPDSGESLENGEAVYEVGPGEQQADSLLLTYIQESEAVQDYEIEETQEWELEYNMNSLAMFNHEIDASIDSVRVADEPIVLGSLYTTEEMEYQSNKELKKASRAIKPFNNEKIPYGSEKAAFETEFRMN